LKNCCLLEVGLELIAAEARSTQRLQRLEVWMARGALDLGSQFCVLQGNLLKEEIQVSAGGGSFVAASRAQRLSNWMLLELWGCDGSLRFRVPTKWLWLLAR